ncbi:F-box/LRR-repeat protein 7-like [Cydia strobilella]|uniref:F-box/LRR-repeat protein 7-like n=1 Tax=Cydia strobilella TaxID=1100964 RepID=UPI003006A8F9
MYNCENGLEEVFQEARVFGLNFLAPSVSYSNHSRGVPAHTEDGISIRTIYIRNLPPKISRIELLGVFAQYGCIKNCHLQMGGRGPTKYALYAFVTFKYPIDALRALLAPDQTKIHQGYQLKTFPADSWHQPAEDADGQVTWEPEHNGQVPLASSSGEAGPQDNSANANREEKDTTENTHTILDILKWDCLAHVLSFVPIIDLIRSERVSKRWQCMVQEHYNGTRLFKTSWWQHGTVTLTTLVLRRVLQRLGPNLKRLHIDQKCPALNDRTPHTVGKFCPNLEELKVFGMDTENWNPVTSGCKFLKAVSFLSCTEVTDSSLQLMMNKKTIIESITVAENRQVTGMFLCSSETSRLPLHTLSFYNCYSLQGLLIWAALDTLPNLKTLRLDVCPVSTWEIVPRILNKLPHLEELSLSDYYSFKVSSNIDFCKSLSKMTELRVLNLSKNIYIDDAILMTVAQTCSKLESLNVSGCNAKKFNPQPGMGCNALLNNGYQLYGRGGWGFRLDDEDGEVGVSDEGIIMICRSCKALRELDISYIELLTDAGVAAAAQCARLVSLTARGNVSLTPAPFAPSLAAALSGAPLTASLTAAPFAAVLDACTELQLLDVCGCDSVSAALLVEAATAALARTPRPLMLRIGGSQEIAESYPSHKLLVVSTEDLSSKFLGPAAFMMVHNITYNSDDSSDDDSDYIFN